MYQEHREEDMVISTLRLVMRELVDMKRLQGLKYLIEEQTMARLLRYCVERVNTVEGIALQEIVNEWFVRRRSEKANTHKMRCVCVSHLLVYARERGIVVAIPDIPRHRAENYQPYVFTPQEASHFLEACDTLPKYEGSLRHMYTPIIFRLMLCCGLRISEVAGLKVSDIDLHGGSVVVRDTKNRVDRYVPMHQEITGLLAQCYAMPRVAEQGEGGYLFKGKYSAHLSRSTIYHWFRLCLDQAGISHLGKGRGPRTHDLRHSFCVYSLRNAFLRGADLNSFLPVLSAYIGHKTPEATQYYLRLTAELYPDILEQVTGYCGYAIPSTRSGG